MEGTEKKGFNIMLFLSSLSGTVVFLKKKTLIASLNHNFKETLKTPITP
jgi:hypothetical protein